MAADLRLPVGGIELSVHGVAADGGSRVPVDDRADVTAGDRTEVTTRDRTDVVLCLHETGASAASWSAFAKAAAAPVKVIRYDRRGWGGSSAPEPYLRTTVGEQAQDALGLLDRLGIGRAALAGSGLGAVAAIDLALREPTRVRSVIAVEPPLLALAEGATEGLSHDLETLRDAAEEIGDGGGRQAAAELFVAGELPYLAPGSDRLAAREMAGGGDGGEPRRHPASLIAELGAVPAWPLPFEALAGSSVPLMVVIGSATPEPLRQAASALVDYAPSARPVDLDEPDPLSAPALAELSG